MKKFDEWLKNRDTELYNEVLPIAMAAARMIPVAARALAPAAKTVAKDMAIGKATEKGGSIIGGLLGGDKMKKQKKLKK